MKRQRVLSFLSLRVLWDTPHLVFLTAMLLCGALAGSCTGLRSGHSEGGAAGAIGRADGGPGTGRGRGSRGAGWQGARWGAWMAGGCDPVRDAARP